MGGLGSNLDPYREKRVQCSADIDAQITIKRTDGRDTFCLGRAEPDRKQVAQTLHPGADLAICLIGDRFAECGQMCCLWRARDGIQRLHFFGKRPGKLELHQRRANHAANAAVGL